MATPDWKGLFEWSIKHQDGTGPAADVRAMNPDDRAWFEEAMKEYTMDVGQRMKNIRDVLDTKTEDTEKESVVREKEMLLDELTEIVENIDYAKDLTKIGGLEMLLSLLESPHASLRSRAAEVTATCAQCNPPVQDWFLQGGALPQLLKLVEDNDTACRQKALLAISCLIRNNSAGLNAFLASGGVEKLISLLDKDSPRIQRKALQLMTHIAHEAPHVIPVSKYLSLLLRHMNAIDGDLREASLALLVEMTSQADNVKILREDKRVVTLLRERQDQISRLPEEDKDALQDETVYLQQLLRRLDINHSVQNLHASSSAPSTETKPVDPPTLLLKM